MQITLAEHIALFTPKTRFRERKFLRHLRRLRRKTAQHKPDKNKQLAID